MLSSRASAFLFLCKINLKFMSTKKKIFFLGFEKKNIFA